MEKITIKPFANFEAIMTIFGDKFTPLNFVAQFTNNTKTPITITKVLISVNDHFLFFSKTYDTKTASFKVNDTLDLNLNLRFLANKYGKDKRFTIIAKDSDGNRYESDWSALGLYKNN